jgi:hypothetical protein
MLFVDSGRRCFIITVIGSVANGFVLPLKEEHVVFFHQTLLPLYRRYATRALFCTCYATAWPSPRRSCCISRFAASLTCICRTFMAKDAALSHAVIKYLLRFWPVSCADKVLVFLCTIKDALMFFAATDVLELALARELVQRLRACMGRCASRRFGLCSKPSRDTFPSQSIKGHLSNGCVFLLLILPCRLFTNVSNVRSPSTHSNQQAWSCGTSNLSLIW